MKIIITGATGFIGRNLLEDYDFSHFDVTLITRDLSKLESFSKKKKYKFVKADLNDLESLCKAFENQDILINLAAEVRDSSKLEETNVLGTNNIIEAIKRSTIQKVIHLSSVGVVGEGYNVDRLVVNENHPPDPKNEYERTKFISENLLLSASNDLGFQFIVFRPTNVFGEFHPFNALLNLMKHIKNNGVLFYQKGAVVNYIYVKDLTHIIYNSITNNEMLGIFNVGKSMLIKDFYHLLKYNLKSKSKLITLPNFIFQLLAFFKIHKLNSVSNHTMYDDSKLETYICYKYDYEKGIKSTIQFYKLNKKLE